MGKLIFRNHDQAKITAAIEEMLRQETGAGSPISYKVENEAAIGAGTVAGEVLHAVLGGERTAIRLFTLHFSMTQPKPSELWVQVNKQGIGSYAGPLLYAVHLDKPVGGEASLEAGKNETFGGDLSTAGKLNAAPALAARIQKLLRIRMQAGAFTISTHPFFKLVPQGATSLLLVNTFPRSVNLGFGSTLDAKELFDIAALVEAAL